jgi:hypothetical protein
MVDGSWSLVAGRWFVERVVASRASPLLATYLQDLMAGPTMCSSLGIESLTRPASVIHLSSEPTGDERADDEYRCQHSDAQDSFKHELVNAGSFQDRRR